MKFANFGLLAVALIVAAAARGSDEDASGLSNSAKQTTFFFCRTSYVFDGNKLLFSRTQSVAAGVAVPELVNSYRAFVVKNYGYPQDKSVSCPFRSGASESLAESNRQQTIENARAANLQVIDTDWLYKPAVDVPATPSPPPAPTADK